MILEKRMNKRTKVAAVKSKLHRPCKDCLWFRWLDAGKRFGICDKHEKPSESRVCVVYKRKGIEKL